MSTVVDFFARQVERQLAGLLPDNPLLASRLMRLLLANEGALYLRDVNALAWLLRTLDLPPLSAGIMARIDAEVGNDPDRFAAALMRRLRSSCLDQTSETVFVTTGLFLVRTETSPDKAEQQARVDFFLALAAILWRCKELAEVQAANGAKQ